MWVWNLTGKNSTPGEIHELKGENNERANGRVLELFSEELNEDVLLVA